MYGEWRCNCDWRLHKDASIPQTQNLIVLLISTCPLGSSSRLVQCRSPVVAAKNKDLVYPLLVGSKVKLRERIGVDLSHDERRLLDLLLDYVGGSMVVNFFGTTISSQSDGTTTSSQSGGTTVSSQSGGTTISSQSC